MFSARKISHNLYYSFLTSFLFLSYSFSTSFFSLSLSFLFLNFSLPVSFSSSLSISFPLPFARTFSDKQAINYYFQGEGVTIFENCKKIPDNFCVIFFLFANNAVPIYYEIFMTESFTRIHQPENICSLLIVI